MLAEWTGVLHHGADRRLSCRAAGAPRLPPPRVLGCAYVMANLHAQGRTLCLVSPIDGLLACVGSSADPSHQALSMRIAV